jgi:hypothetical protein
MILNLHHIVPALFLLERRVFTNWMRKSLIYKYMLGLFEGLESRFLTTGKQKCEC